MKEIPNTLLATAVTLAFLVAYMITRVCAESGSGDQVLATLLTASAGAFWALLQGRAHPTSTTEVKGDVNVGPVEAAAPLADEADTLHPNRRP